MSPVGSGLPAGENCRPGARVVLGDGLQDRQVIEGGTASVGLGKKPQV
jgi:hypothetical protein